MAHQGAILVVGAGPAGLATAAELKRRGLTYRLVERGPCIGHTWEHLYDSLTLHTGKHMSTLPGLRYPRATSLFPTRREFLDYLGAYARDKQLVVETGREVIRVDAAPNGWRAVFADGETFDTPTVVMATGIVANPRFPSLPGRALYQGRVLHSVEYRRPEPFAGKRVLVVGIGNSGGEIGGELARGGARVTVVVRSGQNVVPKQIGPFPAQYVRYLVGKLPRRAQEFVLGLVQARLVRKYGPPVFPRAPQSVLDAIPLIGFLLVDCIREGLIEVKLGNVAAFTAGGVRFSDGTTGDFDVVLLATGFEAAINALGNQVRRDAKGFAIRTDRVTSADQAGLYFVGHSYDHTGGLTNIRIDARRAARAIQRSSRDRVVQLAKPSGASAH